MSYLLQGLLPLLLLSAGVAQAHPFLDVQPLPPASVPSGSTYLLVLDLYPGDTPVERVQLDFELSSIGAFSAPSAAMGAGFALVYDPIADPLHFSIVGDFTGSPLEEFGFFPVAQLTFTGGTPGGTLSLLDSSFIVALEFGEPVTFERQEFSNVFPSNVVALVAPAVPTMAARGSAALGAVILLSGVAILHRWRPAVG